MKNTVDTPVSVPSTSIPSTTCDQPEGLTANRPQRLRHIPAHLAQDHLVNLPPSLLSELAPESSRRPTDAQKPASVCSGGSQRSNGTRSSSKSHSRSEIQRRLAENDSQQRLRELRRAADGERLRIRREVAQTEENLQFEHIRSQRLSAEARLVAEQRERQVEDKYRHAELELEKQCLQRQLNEVDGQGELPLDSQDPVETVNSRTAAWISGSMNNIPRSSSHVVNSTSHVMYNPPIVCSANVNNHVMYNPPHVQNTGFHLQHAGFTFNTAHTPLMSHTFQGAASSPRITTGQQFGVPGVNQLPVMFQSTPVSITSPAGRAVPPISGTARMSQDSLQSNQNSESSNPPDDDPDGSDRGDQADDDSAHSQGCNWAFTCIQKLSRHMVQHTGDRRYECAQPGCQKLFTRLEHLKTHIKTHTGEKPFVCTQTDCTARFASRSSLFMHVKRHKQGYQNKQKNIFNCPMDECNQSYVTKEGLKKHILTVHSIMLPNANESELVYIPTENPQAMVDAMTDPSLLHNPTVVRITPAPTTDSTATNHLSVNPMNKDNASVLASQNQSSGLVPYTAGACLIVDSNGAPVSFVNSPTTQASTLLSSSWSPRGLHHENWSGSARTDFMYMQGARKGRLTRNSESGDSESDSTLAPSYIPSSFSMTTTASLTLRDPATGARYVQTQLLQDDPPDESELAFQLASHTTTSVCSAVDLNVSAILPATDSHGHAQCPSSSSVDFLQGDRETESSIDGFRESTINLQDLE